MPRLPATMYNSELAVPANVHLLCCSVCFLRTPDNNNVLYVTEKVTQRAGCSVCFLTVRAPYLVLSLFLVLICDPPLPVVAVRHFVWAHKLDTAKVFSPLGDDASHLGWHKQVHLKEAKKKRTKTFFTTADLKFQLWKHGWGGGNHVCCIYLIIPYWTIYVKWIIHLYISTATWLRQFLIKLKSYIPSYPWPSVIIIASSRSLHKMETGEMSISVVHGAT